MALPIIINGINFENILEYTTRSESFRKISGSGAGVSIGGTEIYDDVSTKFDLVCTTKPCKANDLKLLGMQLLQTPVTVTYFSFWRNETVTQTMRCPGAGAALAKLSAQDVITQNVEIQFIEK